MVEQRPGLESGRARREDGGPAIERGIAGQASQAARVGFRSWCGGLQLEGQLRVTEQEPWQRVLARESHGSAGPPHASGPRTSPTSTGWTPMAGYPTAARIWGACS